MPPIRTPKNYNRLRYNCEVDDGFNPEWAKAPKEIFRPPSPVEPVHEALPPQPAPCNPVNTYACFHSKTLNLQCLPKVVYLTDCFDV